MATDSATPSVMLSFGSSSDSWDDRELVNAYDAALTEFHIHNPGPGSWLDKATAALATGQPLPGAHAFGTAWYDAAKPKDKAAPKAAPKPADASSSRSPKRARTDSTNPYTTTAAPRPATRAKSPEYRPPSPGAAGTDDQGDEAADVAEVPAEGGLQDEEGWEEAVEEPRWDEYEWAGGNQWAQPAGAENDGEYGENGHVFPAPSGEWPGAEGTTRDEAIMYALHAQYWAGYWMGVARSAGPERAGGPRAAGPRARVNGNNGANGANVLRR